MRVSASSSPLAVAAPTSGDQVLSGRATVAEGSDLVEFHPGAIPAIPAMVATHARSTAVRLRAPSIRRERGLLHMRSGRQRAVHGLITRLNWGIVLAALPLRRCATAGDVARPLSVGLPLLP